MGREGGREGGRGAGGRRGGGREEGREGGRTREERRGGGKEREEEEEGREGKGGREKQGGRQAGRQAGRGEKDGGRQHSRVTGRQAGRQAGRQGEVKRTGVDIIRPSRPARGRDGQACASTEDAKLLAEQREADSGRRAAGPPLRLGHVAAPALGHQPWVTSLSVGGHQPWVGCCGTSLGWAAAALSEGRRAGSGPAQGRPALDHRLRQGLPAPPGRAATSTRAVAVHVPR